MTKNEEEEAQSQSQEERQQSETTTNPIKEATEAAERLEKANKEKSDLLDREEALVARKMLGGNSEAGYTTVKKTAEEAKVEDAADYFKGTALESAIRNG